MAMLEMIPDDLKWIGFNLAWGIPAILLSAHLSYQYDQAQAQQQEDFDAKTLVTENADYKINQITGISKHVQAGIAG